MNGPCLCGDPECWTCGNGPTPAIYERIDEAVETMLTAQFEAMGDGEKIRDGVVVLVEREVARERARCAAIVRDLIVRRVSMGACSPMTTIGHLAWRGEVAKVDAAVAVAVERIERTHG